MEFFMDLSFWEILSFCPFIIGQLGLNPRSAEFQRTVTSSQEGLSASINAMEMPFESKLRSFVVANEENVNALITDIKNNLSDFKDINYSAATLALDPSDHNVAYTSSLLTSITSTITTNLADTGTGLTTATLNAMYNWRRDKLRVSASRTSRRVTEDLSKKLPFGGLLSDALIEADQVTQDRMTEIEDWITEKQELLTYQFQRDKIRESIQLEQLKLGDHSAYKGRWLQAFIADDEMAIKNNWDEYEFEIRRALGFAPVAIDFALKAASGADQITFENWLKMASVMAEMQIQITGLVANLLPSAQSV